MQHILFAGILTLAIIGMEPALSIMAITTYFTCNTFTSAVILLCLQIAAYRRFIQFTWNPRKFNLPKKDKKKAPAHTISNAKDIRPSTSS